jgi:hypothetical protein
VKKYAERGDLLEVKRCRSLKTLIDKEKAIPINRDGWSSVAPLFLERCNYNPMIEYITIRKLKG